MLVLTRRSGESIVIADNIQVRVVAVNGNRVRLGITAPASVSVARSELLAKSSGGDAPRNLELNAEGKQGKPCQDMPIRDMDAPGGRATSGSTDVHRTTGCRLLGNPVPRHRNSHVVFATVL
jgi:carbon storage regulator